MYSSSSDVISSSSLHTEIRHVCSTVTLPNALLKSYIISSALPHYELCDQCKYIFAHFCSLMFFSALSYLPVSKDPRCSQIHILFSTILVCVCVVPSMFPRPGEGERERDREIKYYSFVLLAQSSMLFILW